MKWLLFLSLLFMAPKSHINITDVKVESKIKAVTIHCKDRPSPATWQQYKDAGATHIVLVPKATAYTFEKTGKLVDHGASNYWSESVNGIREAVVTGRKYGISVIVKLHLYIKEKSNANGDLEKIPYSTALGNAYRPIVLRYAKVCQDAGVPIFVMCNETTEFYKETKYWTDLISSVRKIYSGKSTVGATASNVDEVAFWDQLDYIGISAYYKVAIRKNPSSTEMTVAWYYHRSKLADISEHNNKPVLFTEFGCNAGESLAITPWIWQKNLKGEKLNYSLQAEYYQTMFDTFWKEKWFAGICIWQTYSLSEMKESDEFGTPQGKPAWKVVKQFD